MEDQLIPWSTFFIEKKTNGRSTDALNTFFIVVGFIILIFLSNVAYQFCSNLPVTNDYIVVFASF
jgi:hypothetical protein